MTLKDFYYWLQGYMTSNVIEANVIRNKMKEVQINESTNPYNTYKWTEIKPYSMQSQCSKCGLKLESVMGYVCSQPDCPTGLGGSKC